MATRRLAALIPCNKDSRILLELEDAGFIETVKHGKYAPNGALRTASEYRLTDFRCDVTGELPSRRYNERYRWQPSEPKPRRKVLTDAERAKRYRLKRHERHEQWPVQSDSSVLPSRTPPVTLPKVTKLPPRNPAKNDGRKTDDVTKSVRPNHTLVHLTRGYADSGTPSQGQTGVKSGLALPAGHGHCKLPIKGSLPVGWHWCRSEQRIVTDAGVVLPLVDDPLVGTDERREALRSRPHLGELRSTVGKRMNIVDPATANLRGIMLEVTEIVPGPAPDANVVKVKKVS